MLVKFRSSHGASAKSTCSFSLRSGSVLTLKMLLMHYHEPYLFWSCSFIELPLGPVPNLYVFESTGYRGPFYSLMECQHDTKVCQVLKSESSKVQTTIPSAMMTQRSNTIDNLQSLSLVFSPLFNESLSRLDLCLDVVFWSKAQTKCCSPIQRWLRNALAWRITACKIWKIFCEAQIYTVCRSADVLCHEVSCLTVITVMTHTQHIHTHNNRQ